VDGGVEQSLPHTLGVLTITGILWNVGDEAGNEASPQQAAGYQAENLASFARMQK